MKKTDIFIFGAGMGIGLFANYRLIKNKIYERQEKIANYENQIFLLKRMLMQCKGEDRLDQYLKEHRYKKVAIYGMEHLGQCVMHKLTESSAGLELLFAIDADKVSSEIEIYRPEDSMPEADVVIVTSISGYKSIKEELKTKFSCPIVSLEELI